MDNDLILSQSAIDDLLSSTTEESSPKPAAEVAQIKPEQVQPSEKLNTVEPANANTPLDDRILTFDQVIEIAGQAAEAETGPVHASISRIYQRIGQMETYISRIAYLEGEVERLKNAS